MALTEADYIDAVDRFIKDHGPLNRLLKFEEENTPDELGLYVNMALGFLNGIPPLLEPYSYGTFPIPSLLIHQATIECLISNSIVAARNDLTYNNGGVTVKIQDGDRYLKLLQILYRTTDMEISSYKQLKIALNINGGWGGVPSPYSSLHGRYATLQPNTILSG